MSTIRPSGDDSLAELRTRDTSDSGSRLSRLPGPDLRRLVEAARTLAFAAARPAEVSHLVQVIVTGARELLDVEHVALLLYADKERDALQVRAGTGAFARQEGELLPADVGFEACSIQAGEPQRTDQISDEPDAYRFQDRGLALGPAISAPILYLREATGVLLVARDVGGVPFLERDVELLAGYAEHVAAALASASEFQRVRQSQAQLDAWRRERNLRIWSERAAAVAAHAGIAAFAWDPAADRLEWGPGSATFLEVPSSELGGTAASLIGRISPNHEADARKAFRAASAGAEGVEISCECEVLNGRGESLDVRVRLWKEETRSGVLGLLERRLRGAPADDKAAESGLGRYALIQALRHEINNPLAIVMGQAQLLRTETKVQRDPSLLSSIESILHESERIATLIMRLDAVGSSTERLRLNSIRGLDFGTE